MIISIVGVDGSGKTTLANWLVQELGRKGYKTKLVWSRFRNYLSKPLLALTRLTGHNKYQTIDGIRFGSHDFAGLPVYREVFALLQAIDVNLGALAYIHRAKKKSDVVVCERGPWDTLIDVTSDTGLNWLPVSKLGAFYSFSINRNALVFWVSRSRKNILTKRPELIHDSKLSFRINQYSRLSAIENWHIIDNDGRLDDSKKQVTEVLGL